MAVAAAKAGADKADPAGADETAEAARASHREGRRGGRARPPGQPPQFEGRGTK